MRAFFYSSKAPSSLRRQGSIHINILELGSCFRMKDNSYFSWVEIVFFIVDYINYTHKKADSKVGFFINLLKKMIT